MSAPDQRMVKARSSLIQNQPFFGTLALYLTLVEDEACETMTTDGESLRYAPSYLDQLNANEIKGVIAKLVMRCANQHHVRRGNRDPELWHQAGDYAVNPGVLTAGFTLPAGAYLDKAFTGMGAEEIHARLKAKAQPPQQPQNGQQGAAQPGGPGGNPPGTGSSPAGPQAGPAGTPGKGPNPTPGTAPSSPGGGPQAGGTGAGGTTLPPSPPNAPGDGPMGGATPTGAGAEPLGAGGRVTDASGPGDKVGQDAAKAEWDRRVLQAVSVAKRAGNLPGFLEELVTAIKEVKVDWREELRRFIDSRVRTEHTWNRPNRRFISSGFILPGTQSDGIMKLGFLMDVSGSITKAVKEKVLGQIEDAMDVGAIEEAIVAQVDTRIRGVNSYRQGDDIPINTIIGAGGGTNLSVGIRWFMENEPDVAAIVCLTDLENDYWGEDPGVPVLWAAYGFESRIKTLTEKVPYGEIIRVED